MSTTTPESRTTVLDVSGMSCGHCVNSVTDTLTAVDGVNDVSIVLDAEGVSTVTVVGRGLLDPQVLRAAVDEAGYTVEDVRTTDPATATTPDENA